jgi:ribosomal protein S24E
MKLEIIDKKSNPLLSREEISFTVKDFTSTPSRKDIQAKISALTNSKDELVVVGKLNQKYGSSEAIGEARVYKDKTLMNKTELPHFIKRNFSEKSKEKKEEAKPAEEKNEDSKPEAKTE